jgi:hypothetical protein
MAKNKNRKFLNSNNSGLYKNKGIDNKNIFNYIDVKSKVEPIDLAIELNEQESNGEQNVFNVFVSLPESYVMDYINGISELFFGLFDDNNDSLYDKLYKFVYKDKFGFKDLDSYRAHVNTISKNFTVVNNLLNVLKYNNNISSNFGSIGLYGLVNNEFLSNNINVYWQT